MSQIPHTPPVSYQRAELLRGRAALLPAPYPFLALPLNLQNLDPCPSPTSQEKQRPFPLPVLAALSSEVLCLGLALLTLSLLPACLTREGWRGLPLASASAPANISLPLVSHDLTGFPLLLPWLPPNARALLSF